MKMKPLMSTLAVLGIALLASFPVMTPTVANHATEAYTAALAAPDKEDYDDFNGIRFKLFFPNTRALTY